MLENQARKLNWNWECLGGEFSVSSSTLFSPWRVNAITSSSLFIKWASEEILWELFVQAGPVVNVYVPKDRVTNAHQGYGFVEFRSEEDSDYAIKVLNMIKLYGKAIRVNKASQDKKSVDVGANLFIGNLDPDVDEKLLYDTFSAFGVIVTNPKRALSSWSRFE